MVSIARDAFQKDVFQLFLGVRSWWEGRRSRIRGDGPLLVGATSRDIMVVHNEAAPGLLHSNINRSFERITRDHEFTSTAFHQLKYDRII